MGGTKIFVLQIKDLIRLGAFLLIGLVVLIVLVFFFTPRQGEEDTPPARPTQSSAAIYIPGTYTATIILNDRPLDIMVTVTETEIISVEMSEMYESQRMLFPLFEPLMARISDDVLFYQRADIVFHNDSPTTTAILQQAVAAALNQATLP